MANAQLYYGIANPEVGADSCGIEMAQYIFFFAPDEKEREKRHRSVCSGHVASDNLYAHSPRPTSYSHAKCVRV